MLMNNAAVLKQSTHGSIADLIRQNRMLEQGLTMPNAATQPHHDFRSHLRMSLVICFVVLAVLPLTVMVSFALDQADKQAHLQAVAQLESVASIKFNEVERWLNDQGIILNLLLNDSDKYQAELELLHGKGDATVVSEHLTQHLNGQQTFTEFFVYDTNGQIVASTSRVQQGKIITGQAYFVPSLTRNYIQSPFYEVSAGELNMILSRPIRDANQAVIGVLAGRLDLNELSKIMSERAGLGNTGETYLVSLESNYLVTTSRFEEYPVMRAYHSQGIDEALEGKNGSGIYSDYRGVLTIGIYRWVPELQVGLLAEMDEREAVATLYLVRNVMLVAGLIIAVIAISVGWLISLRLTRPILTLTRVANQVAGGNYGLRVPMGQYDEIGQLGNSFNIMTETLTHTINQLNQQVTEVNQANEALKIARDQAQAALRAKDDFIAVMSHELRTPLNAILGFTEIITLSSKVDERTLSKLERIQANAHRLLTLVNNVLDMSRITSGKLELRYQPFDLQAFIDDLSKQMDVLAHNKGLQLQIEMDSNLPKAIMSNREALTKIITNLLSNAFKFTEQGAVDLKVYYQSEKLKMEVRDTGIGIPEAMHEAIFESFRQVDNSSLKRAYSGSGLGLAIVKQLCAALGGQITLSSIMGQGSTFTVTLPLETHNIMEITVV
jgi:signal transduction histidine kinase